MENGKQLNGKHITDDELVDGHSAADIFGSKLVFTGYTYDDLILLPRQINFGLNDVDLSSNLSSAIWSTNHSQFEGFCAANYAQTRTRGTTHISRMLPLV